MAKKRDKNPQLWFILGFFFGVLALLYLHLDHKYSTKQKKISPSNISSKRGFPSSRMAQTPNKPTILEKLWYFLDEKENQYGPMSFYALKRRFDEGEIDLRSYIWNEEMEDWKKIENLPDCKEWIEKADLSFS